MVLLCFVRGRRSVTELSVCLSVCLSACLPACLSVCLRVSGIAAVRSHVRG